MGQSTRTVKADVEEIQKEISTLLLEAKETDELLEQKKHEWQSEFGGYLKEVGLLLE